MARLLTGAAVLAMAVQAQEGTLRGRRLSAGGNAGASSVDLRYISKVDLRDKLEGFWIGQLVGNFMGLPFEFIYYNDPMPLLPDKYYDLNAARAAGLMCNTDGRGWIPQYLNKIQGAYTDDDTDIEFVTLHTVEQPGIGLNVSYPQIAEAWKKYVHIKVGNQDALWFANKVARELMDQGVMPPATGAQERNKYWWTIDPQLVNEIWSAFYPGMVAKAVERAEWGARITSSSWGTHPTRFYGALYSAAFFVTDVEELYEIGMSVIPEDSIFLQGLKDVKDLHAQHPEDWRAAWYVLKHRYLHYPAGTCGGVPWNCGVSAMINGVMGALALRYGGGDFMRTVGIAIAAGFDCDNQAATLAGLIGILHGGSQIPKYLTHEIAGNTWTKPFNDKYINERRPPLPVDNSNTDIVNRIAQVTREAIIQSGGREENNEGFYVPVSGLPPAILLP